jgi:hypothetical protein
VCNAIARKRCLSFQYKPTDATARLFAPHVAWVTPAGNACVHGCQLKSETGHAVYELHTFTIADMVGLNQTIETFNIDPSFDRNKPRDNVLCIVGP